MFLKLRFLFFFIYCYFIILSHNKHKRSVQLIDDSTTNSSSPTNQNSGTKSNLSVSLSISNAQIEELPPRFSLPLSVRLKQQKSDQKQSHSSSSNKRTNNANSDNEGVSLSKMFTIHDFSIIWNDFLRNSKSGATLQLIFTPLHHSFFDETSFLGLENQGKEFWKMFEILE